MAFTTVSSSLPTPCGRIVDQKPTRNLSPLESISSPPLCRPPHNVVLPKSLSSRINAMVKQLYFNKDAAPPLRSRSRYFTLSVALSQTDVGGSSSSISNDDNSYALPKIDKNGRFCSPRAARELALLILYASCLEGSNPIRLFEKRLNAPRELNYGFDKSSLLQYDHVSFGGPPIATATMEDANQLLNQFETESAIEAEVLSAPPKLVYSKLLLRFTKELLKTVVDRWDNHVVIIDKVTPPNWKIEPAGRILELSILHLAISEISSIGTKHQIVINEAVDLAKRFCDGAAPRIINGCLRTFVQDLSETGV